MRFGKLLRIVKLIYHLFLLMYFAMYVYYEANGIAYHITHLAGSHHVNFICLDKAPVII